MGRGPSGGGGGMGRLPSSPFGGGRRGSTSIPAGAPGSSLTTPLNDTSKGLAPMGGFVPTSISQLGMISISEDKQQKADKKGCDLPNYSRGLAESKATYGTMSAKNRGEKTCHKGPLELRKTREPRDCTSWIRQDKQYSPYSYFESPDNKPSKKPKQSALPPSLWLLKDPIKKKPKDSAAVEDEMPLGAEAGEDGAVFDDFAKPNEGLEDRPAWDTEHHIMHSRMNHELQVGTREYFDRPVKKEGVGVPKIREQYVLNDRQCCWNDEPAPLGEYRYTVFDSMGPSKVQQLPSYWRRVGAWSSFSTPDLHLSISRQGKPKEKPPNGRKAMLQAMADLPADQSKAYWKEWAEKQAPSNTLPAPNRWDRPRGWDDRWNLCSQSNDEINPRLREYFAVPQGVPGRCTEAPRQTTSPNKRSQSTPSPKSLGVRRAAC